MVTRVAMVGWVALVPGCMVPAEVRPAVSADVAAQVAAVAAPVETDQTSTSGDLSAVDGGVSIGSVQIGGDSQAGFEGEPSNNRSHDVDTLIPLAYDLAVSKSDGTTTAEPGDLLTYTISYTNTNALNIPIEGVVLTETLDPAAYMSYVGGGPWTEVAPGIFRYEVGTLPAGTPGSATFVVSVSPVLPTGTEPGTYMGITNTVQIGDDSDQGVDSITSNNSDIDIDIVHGPDLAITNVSLSPWTPVISEALTIEVTIMNQGVSGIDAW